MTYQEKLKDPRWQKKRLEIFQRDVWHCRSCGMDNVELHIHHLIYSRGKDPWEYDNEALLSVCGPCHDTLEDHRESVLNFMGEDVDWFDMYFSMLVECGLNRQQVIDRLRTWAEAYKVFAGLGEP